MSFFRKEDKLIDKGVFSCAEIARRQRRVPFLSAPIYALSAFMALRLKGPHGNALDCYLVDAAIALLVGGLGYVLTSLCNAWAFFLVRLIWPRRD
ncbi:hypothetical protein [Methylobacterium indicum]|uniref:Uncharacterized protein n=1 Tax=Methylobacterium indicum TaxID=1775910 RepID=A0A8H9C4A1_9HYPH|nr:hypothetical protein [Methylobacterium indicum]BCM82281.1 hypothetical protein mvi_07420 [Methylobacterium indicum]